MDRESRLLAMDLRREQLKEEELRQQKIDHEGRRMMKQKALLEEVKKMGGLLKGDLLKKHLVLGLIPFRKKCKINVFDQGHWVIYYIRNQENPNLIDDAGMISPSSITSMKPTVYDLKEINLGSEFQISTPELTYDFRAETEDDMRLWIQGFNLLRQQPVPDTKKQEEQIIVGHPIAFKDVQLKEGCLEVLQKVIIDFWEPRWVVLRDGSLFILRDKGKEVISSISLFGVKLNDYSKDNCFRVESQMSSSSIVIRHENPQTLFEWSTAILKHKIICEEVIEFMLSLEKPNF